MFTHILAPIDGSDCSNRAFEVALRLAKSENASLTACYVVDAVQAASPALGPYGSLQPWLDALTEAGNQTLTDAVAQGAKVGVTVRAELQDGGPVSCISELAKTIKADLIVMGSHGRGGIARLLMGSVAEGVMRSAICPVMVVRDVSAASTNYAPAKANSLSTSG